MPDRRLVPVPYQTLVRIFEKDGFSLARQEGDHKIFTKAGVLRPLVIPTYRAVPVFIIRNLACPECHVAGHCGERAQLLREARRHSRGQCLGA